MKEIAAEYIIKYLEIVSNYSERFYPLYLDRLNI